MKKLEAVNRLLQKIRERRVGSLNEPLNQDARTAVGILDQTSQQVQLRGWTFNTERKFTLERDASNHLVLPTNALRVVVSETHRSFDHIPVQRGNRLYDPKNRTYAFDTDLEVDLLVVELPWDELPPVAQNFIASVAAVEFIHTSQGDDRALAVAQREERVALLEMNRMYANNVQVNLLEGPDTVGIANRRRIGRG